MISALKNFAGGDKNIAKYYAYRALIKRFVLPILVVFMIDRGLSVPQIAAIASISAAASFILEIPSGMIADRIGHKRALVISSIGQGIGMALYFGGTFPWILAGSAVYFATGALMTGTVQALFFEYLKEKKLEKEYQKYSGRAISFASGVGILSMLLAGLAYTVHPMLPFVVGILQFTGSAVIIGTFKQAANSESVEKREAHLTVLKHFPNAWRKIRSDRRLFWLIIAGTITGAIFGSTEFEQVLMKDVGMIAASIGVLYAAKRVVAMVLSPFVHKLTKKTSPAGVILGCMICAAGFFFLPLAMTTPWTIVIPIVLGTIGARVFSIAGMDYMNQLTQGASRATVLSIGNMVQGTAKISAAAVFGFLALQLTTAQSFAVIGVVVVTIGFYITWRTRGAYKST